MHKFYNLTVLLLIGFFLSCKTSKKVSDITSPITMNQEYYLKSGFVKGKLVFNKSENRGYCSRYIKVAETDELLDPINIDKKYKEFDNSDIWVKFSSLRMKNRCEEARPISIIDIQKRAE